jgi:hypothetical protein
MTFRRSLVASAPVPHRATRHTAARQELTQKCVSFCRCAACAPSGAADSSSPFLHAAGASFRRQRSAAFTPRGMRGPLKPLGQRPGGLALPRGRGFAPGAANPHCQDLAQRKARKAARDGCAAQRLLPLLHGQRRQAPRATLPHHRRRTGQTRTGTRTSAGPANRCTSPRTS